MSPSRRETQAEVQRFRQFEMLARSVVEGSISGRHHSPYKGFAIEFEEHRQYAPGDDLKHLDWKVLGKLSRYYIKQYEEDTTLRAYLVVDISGSMHYTSAGRSKLETARMAAQVLSYLLIQQQDAVGLMTCDNRLRTHLPPRATKPQYKRISDVLAAADSRADTGLGPVLHQLADRIKRRALIVIISDLFDKPEDICLALNHFAHRRHEVVVFQTLDRNETTFPFKTPTAFDPLEGGEALRVDPARIRRAYLEKFNAHRERIQRTCFDRRIDLVPLYTDDPFETVMARYLAERTRRT
ncbi:MAG: DUF58 domain-containing protein [Verrucomicrobia bacterium]|nr:DUF58 domain-containing protein [Verrucomicrobiota bacterium]MCH8525599.1 DUF58 domain-containing protein [Kiritimatiellia bacterium]